MTRPATAPTANVAREAVVRWSLGVLLVAGAVLVIVLVVGGGAPEAVPEGLPNAGAVTGWLLPVSRLAADLLGFLTVGLLLGAALLLPSPAMRLSDEAQRCMAWANGTALAWAGVVAVEVVLTVSDIFGSPVSTVAEPTVLRSFLSQTEQGQALLVQLALAVITAGVARSAVSSRGAALAGILAVLAITPPALTGHSASAGSHEMAVASLVVHVVAASLWVGGLAGLAFVAASGSESMRYAVPRFSNLAGWCFAAVAASGVVNAALRLGGWSPLVGSAYGRLVLAKFAALGVLGVFGWWHRRTTVPQQVRAMATTTGRRTAAKLFLVVAAAELVVMAATIALAVGLSRTPTPQATVVDVSPATDLLGFPLPAAPSVGRLLVGWVPDGFALAFVALAASLYAAGVLALRRRGVRWPVGRTVCWAGALVVFAWCTFGGLGLYSHVLFSAHMVAHMLLSMVVPIGLVLGAPVTLALRTLPGPRVAGELGARQLLLALLHSHAARVLMHPLVAFAIFVGSLYGLYFTNLFPTLMGQHLGHAAMEFHFVASGFLFFFVLVGVDPTPYQLPSLARIGLLFAAMPFHAFFSVAIMSSDAVLARGYYSTLHRPYATDLLSDQHLGGGIGWAMGEIPVVLVLGAVFVQWVRLDAREAARFDRAADRAARRGGRSDGAGHAAADDELGRYNAYLASLASRAEREQHLRHKNTSPDERTPR